MTAYHVVIDGHEFTVEVGAGGILLNGQAVQAELSVGRTGSGRAGPTALLLDGASWHWQVTGVGGGHWQLHAGGRTLEAEVLDERARTIRALVRRSAAASGPRPLKAPMPGLVVKVEVGEGDLVEAGQGLVVVEAMKMENELKAQGAGRVARVHVESGDTVEKDQVLVEFAPPKTPPDGNDQGEGADDA